MALVELTAHKLVRTPCLGNHALEWRVATSQALAIRPMVPNQPPMQIHSHKKRLAQQRADAITAQILKRMAGGNAFA
jgi:hypothetical protein